MFYLFGADDDDETDFRTHAGNASRERGGTKALELTYNVMNFGNAKVSVSPVCNAVFLNANFDYNSIKSVELGKSR